MYQPRDQDKPGNFLPKVSRSPDAAKKFTSAIQAARPKRYVTDGTGRDGYVQSGDGGFTNPFNQAALDPRVVFQRSLRDYGQDPDYQTRRKQRLQMKGHTRHLSHLDNSHRYSTQQDLEEELQLDRISQFSDTKHRINYSQTKLRESNLLAGPSNSSSFITDKMKHLYESRVRKDASAHIASYESKKLV